MLGHSLILNEEEGNLTSDEDQQDHQHESELTVILTPRPYEDDDYEEWEPSSQQVEEDEGDLTQLFRSIKALQDKARRRGNALLIFSEFYACINRFFPSKKNGYSRHLLKANLKDNSKTLFHYLAIVQYQEEVKNLFFALISKAEERDIANPLDQRMSNTAGSMTPFEYAIFKLNYEYADLIAKTLANSKPLESFKHVLNLLMKPDLFSVNPKFIDFYYRICLYLLDKFGGPQYWHKEKIINKRLPGEMNYIILCTLLHQIEVTEDEELIDFIAEIFNEEYIKHFIPSDKEDLPILHRIVKLANYNTSACKNIILKINPEKLRKFDNDFRDNRGSTALLASVVYIDKPAAVNEIMPLLFSHILTPENTSSILINYHNSNILHRLFKKQHAGHVIPLILDTILEKLPNSVVKEFLIKMDNDGNSPLATAIKDDIVSITKSQSSMHRASDKDPGIVRAVEKIVGFCNQHYKDIFTLPHDNDESTLLLLVLRHPQFHRLIPAILPLSDKDKENKYRQSPSLLARNLNMSLDLISHLDAEVSPPVYYVSLEKYEQARKKQAAELEILKNQNINLKNQLQLLQDEAEGYKNEIKKLAFLYLEIKNACINIINTIKSKENIIRILEKSINLKIQEIRRISAIKEEQEIISQKAIADLETLQQTFNTQTIELGNLKNNLTHIQNSKVELEARNTLITQSLQTKQKEAAALQTALADTQNKLQAAGASVTALKSGLDQATVCGNNMAAKLKQSEDNEKKLSAANLELNKQMQSLIKEKQQLEAKLKSYEDAARGQVSPRPLSPLGRTASAPSSYSPRLHPPQHCSPPESDSAGDECLEPRKKKAKTNASVPQKLAQVRYGLEKKLDEYLQIDEVRKHFACIKKPYELNYSSIAITSYKPSTSKEPPTDKAASLKLKLTQLQEKINQVPLSKETKNAIGHCGEAIIYRKLQEHYMWKYRKEIYSSVAANQQPELIDGSFEIKGFSTSKKSQITFKLYWLNKDKEQEDHKDLVVKKEYYTPEGGLLNSTKKYLEIKATRSPRKNFISLSGKEAGYLFKYGNRYTIFRVYNVGNEQPNIIKITNCKDKIEKGEIRVKSLQIWG